MSTVNPTNATAGISFTSTDNSQSTTPSKGVFSYGLDVMYMYMEMLTSLANSQFSDMQAHSNAALDAQGMSNKTNAILSGLKDNTKTGILPKEVIDYLNLHDIQLTTMDLSKWEEGNALTFPQLTEIKGVLDNEANRASDYVSQAQLQMQKVMQTYSTTVALINSTQTMLSEMNKSIAQNIR